MKTLLFREDPGPVAVYCIVWFFLLARSHRRRRKQIAWGGASALTAWMLFYRDEQRLITHEHQEFLIFSACDGIVLSATDTEVIVFLSPLDMHTQKAPCAGTVKSIEHKEGTFNAAFILEKTHHNEQTITTFSTQHGDIEVVSIAGQLARRIVSFVEVGDMITAGETFGMIKFGSQVRLKVPRGFRCLTTKGSKVKAAETPLFVTATNSA